MPDTATRGPDACRAPRSQIGIKRTSSYSFCWIWCSSAVRCLRSRLLACWAYQASTPGFNPRLRSLARHEGIEARGGAAKGATALQRQGLMGSSCDAPPVGHTLHGPHFGPNAHRHQVVHQCLTRAREGDIDYRVPGLEAVGIAGLGEELPGFLGIVRVRLQCQGPVELYAAQSSPFGPSNRASALRSTACRLMAWFAARRTRLSYHGDLGSNRLFS